MAKTPSTMIPLGTAAAPFCLPDTSGRLISLDSLLPCSGLLIAYWCNHCPYVRHIQPAFVKRSTAWQQLGIKIVAINSNDAERYPEDAPAAMSLQAREQQFAFPYLFDADQSIAHAYQAACTPDFFLFDPDMRLFYRGQFDASRPGNTITPSGQDIDVAITALLARHNPPSPQLPSLGCNIKWKPGTEPDYFHV